MLGALAQIVPERVPAAGEGGNSVICISGLRPNRKPFIIVDMICGAWGGRPDKDGVEAVTNASQNLSNMPVEVMEAEHPVRVEEYALVPDSCGAGKWRGGIGLRALLSHPGATRRCCSCAPIASCFEPYGLPGGQPGGRSRNFIEIGNRREPLPGKDDDDGAARRLIMHEQAGGGGFGDPAERDLDLVRDDVLEEKISPEFARRHYGLASK